MLEIPSDVMEQMRAHAQAWHPREACGLVHIHDDRAVNYLPGVNMAEGNVAFRLVMPNPDVWQLEEFGAELAVFHSHVLSGPDPSIADRTMFIENPGRRFLIMGAAGDLNCYRFHHGTVHRIPVHQVKTARRHPTK